MPEIKLSWKGLWKTQEYKMIILKLILKKGGRLWSGFVCFI